MTNQETAIPQGEGETCEFRATFNKAVIESLVAFANTRGGTVWLGISDKADVLGVQLHEESVQNWLNEIKQKTEPALVPHVDIVSIDGKSAVLLRVAEVPIKPIAVQGRYYARRGNSNHLLSLDEIVELRMQSINQSFDAFPVRAEMDDLDARALALFSEKTKNSGRFVSSGKAATDLSQLGLIQKNSLTRAAELLFGQHHTSIHIGRFKSASTIIDDVLISQPLVLAVEEAMAFIKRNIRLGYEFTGELSRKDRWQYPLPVLRELLLNAVIHRDYRNGTDVIIKIFDDEILFSNPGSLYGSLTVADLMTDSYQPSHRNKLLAEVFYLMGEVEKYGTGFIRIREWMKDYPHLAVSIKDRGDFTWVTIGVQQEFVENGTENGTENGIENGTENNASIKERAESVLNEIAHNPQISIGGLVVKIGVSRRTIIRDIEKLKVSKRLRRVGPDKGGYWEVSGADG